MGDSWKPRRSHDIFDAEERATLDKYYWHRPMLSVRPAAYTGGPQLSIMTYNLLHPCDKEKYPISGLSREHLLMCEIARYNPDIVCLQEVNNDIDWANDFGQFGYTVVLTRPNKFHGMAIAYKQDLLEEIRVSKLCFRDIDTGSVLENFPTLHGALFVCLGFKPPFLEGHNPPSRDAIIIGTTHLPSSGVRAFHRARAAAIILEYASTFAKQIVIKGRPSPTFYSFIAGDFNSTVDDAAYRSLVSKPVDFSGWARDMLVRSINHDNRTEEEERPRPAELLEKRPQTMEKLYSLEDLHNRIHKKAVSLYSVGYGVAHAANCRPGSNEPWFSFWGKHSHELVDYIFAIADWDGRTHSKIDSVQKCSDSTQVKLLALLGMPTHDDMGSEDVSQPVLGEFPSDHLCLMADMELL